MDQPLAIFIQGNLFKTEPRAQGNKAIFNLNGSFVWLDLYGKKDLLLPRFTLCQSDIDKIQELLNKIICYE